MRVPDTSSPCSCLALVTFLVSEILGFVIYHVHACARFLWCHPGECVQCLVCCRYVGYALTTQWEGQEALKLQMIGFDMGGTSTDVSRFAGSYEHVFESTTAGAS